MNKEQFVSVLQIALFSFDESTEQEILELNPDYPVKLVKAGCSLCSYLKSLKVEDKCRKCQEAEVQSIQEDFSEDFS
jgi:hypothetical protein